MLAPNRKIPHFFMNVYKLYMDIPKAGTKSFRFMGLTLAVGVKKSGTIRAHLPSRPVLPVSGVSAAHQSLERDHHAGSAQEENKYFLLYLNPVHIMA